MRKKTIKFMALMCVFSLIGAGLVGCKAPTIKVEKGTVRIGVMDRGYGKQFAYDLVKAFNEKESETGYKAQVVMDTAESAMLYGTMEAGTDNEIDLYFAESAPIFEWLSRKDTFIPGYDYMLADLEDVLNAPADPAYKEAQVKPGLTNRDLINPSALKSLTLDENGKVYAIPWTSDITGIYYNHKLLTELNSKLDADAKIELPKTTNEMFEVFEQVKGINGVNNKPYALKFGNQHNYLDNCAFTTWVAQYEGQEEIDNFLQGKNAKGEYTPEIFKSDSRRASLKVMEKMLAQKNGYAAIGDYALHVFMAQDQFFDGDALFHFNGGWLEREQSLKYKPDEYDVRAFKMPVVSDIVNKWPETFNGATPVEKDVQLRKALDYIDGECEKPAFLNGHDDVVAALKVARNTISSKGVHMNSFIPACSENLAGAKEFLKFMLTKEGEEILFKGSYGNISGLKVDPTQFDCYATATETQKSRLTVYTEAEMIMNFVKKNPMEYLGGLAPYRDGASPQKTFAASSPKSVDQYIEDEFNDYSLKWDSMLKQAGIKK